MLINGSAFFRKGNTHVIACTTTSSTALLVGTDSTAYRLFNDGAVAVAFNLSPSAALGAVVYPTAGVPQDCYVIAPGVTEVFRGPQLAYIRAVTASGTSNLTVTPGEGE